MTYRNHEIIYFITYCFREQAADYIRDPSTSDSRRGLKRSWKGTPVEDGEEGTSTSKSKPSSKEKGIYVYMHICGSHPAYLPSIIFLE